MHSCYPPMLWSVWGVFFVIIKEELLCNKTLHQAANMQWYNKIRWRVGCVMCDGWCVMDDGWCEMEDGWCEMDDGWCEMDDVRGKCDIAGLCIYSLSNFSKWPLTVVTRPLTELSGPLTIVRRPLTASKMLGRIREGRYPVSPSHRIIEAPHIDLPNPSPQVVDM